MVVHNSNFTAFIDVFTSNTYVSFPIDSLNSLVRSFLQLFAIAQHPTRRSHSAALLHTLLRVSAVARVHREHHARP
jgi:hypothetical protein